MAIRTSITMTIDIQFSDEDRARAYFIDGEWSEIHFEADDLNALSNLLAKKFLNKEEFWGEKIIEHFGVFKLQEGGVWTSHHIEYGQIAIRTRDVKEGHPPVEINDFYPQQN